MSDRARRSVSRSLYDHLWSAPQRTLGQAVRAQGVAALQAVTLVRVFYAASTLWMIDATRQWRGYLELERIDPLWPAQWDNLVGDHRALLIILYGYFGATLLVLVWPERRLARAVYAVMLLQYMAFANSLGKINHGTHPWFFVAVAFIALPNGRWSERRRIRDRQYFITILWAAQVLVLLFYSLAGVWKVWTAVRDRAAGRANAFEISAFSYIVAKNLESETTLLGDFFIRNELIGWLAFLSTMYLEAGSVIVAFRPRLHRLWGIGLIGFHIGTNLVMRIGFDQNILLVGVLLVCSPFAVDRPKVRETVLDLPGIHVLHRFSQRWSRRRVART